MKEKLKETNYKAIQKRDLIVTLTVFFILSVAYFMFAADYILSFQKEQFLFIFSMDYMKSFLAQPGGLLEYSGKFLMQFYEMPVAGAIILSLVISSSAYLFFKICNTIKPESRVAVPVSLLAASLLLLMQNQFYHLMQFNLGFICVLIVILFTIRSKSNYLHFILFPLVYYITGAYALIYFLAYCVFCATILHGKDKYIKPAIMMVVAIITFFLFRKFLFIVPAKTLLEYPLPQVNNISHKIFFISFVVIIVFSPFLQLLSFQPRNYLARFSSLVAGLLLILAAFIISLKLQNPMISGLLKMEKAAYEDKWDEIINFNAKEPSDNLIGQYYYNTALAEKGLLCDKLFDINQGYGTKALILPWGGQHLERGSLFFYASGLEKEAHRWAYEEMVVYGFRPHNIRMLIRTSLADHNFGESGKYIEILKKTLFYRKEAIHYENLKLNPEKIPDDKEIGPVERIIPRKDFFIYMDSPEDNLPSLFESNPANTRAFEYMMAWLLLEKNIETVVSNIHLMKDMGYKKIPVNIEEAILIYYNSQHIWPDMGGLTINPATLARFDQYINTYVQTRNNNPAKLQETMKTGYRDTFWYFFHFAQVPAQAKK